MTRNTETETPAQSTPFADVPAFVAASPELQAAIVAAIGSADPVHLYPALHAWVDGFEREEQDVPRGTAAHLLAHIPPPFYTTAEAAAAGRLLTD